MTLKPSEHPFPSKRHHDQWKKRNGHLHRRERTIRCDRCQQTTTKPFLYLHGDEAYTFCATCREAMNCYEQALRSDK